MDPPLLPALLLLPLTASAFYCPYSFDKDTCYTQMANDTLPCYCLDNNWFYSWYCCFEDPPEPASMFQCWCGGDATTTGLAVMYSLIACTTVAFAIAMTLYYLAVR
eukprot:CAMPEP_0184728738 /NCGR_PEP_ID=MMETSP0314-20130426/41628_1 /TAXON_ID=38298 /ORGANISM="Rhodella maculata, Strain CCMP 736" /LENGTH=105 /DNA_ID=CAMNT_0027194633 /DNA_START=15 /DNA_END=329 /DNA_ORIENTATION=-